VRKITARIKWFLFWGFILCLIFGPFIGWNTEAHAIGQVAGHAFRLVATVWDATIGQVFGHHGVSIH
jgi:hypothetical protein